MENQLTAIGPTYIQDFREFGVMPFQASHMDDIEVAFLTVYLSDVRIEFGAMHGEDIHTVDDLQLGDEVSIRDRQQGFAANRMHRQQSTSSCSDNNAHLVSKMAECARKQQLRMVAENGSVVKAYAITPDAKFGKRPYLLLPRSFRPAHRYCLIEVCDF